MLQNAQLSRNINGVHTDVVLQTFADRIIVLVTQVGKVGNLIQATLPSTIPLLPAPPPPPPSSSSSPNPTSPSQPPPHRPLPPPHPSTELTPLLGSALTPSLQALHSLYTSHIATIVWTAESGMMGQGRRGIVVGLALKRGPNANAGSGEEGARMGEEDTELFRSVMDMVAEVVETK